VTPSVIAPGDTNLSDATDECVNFSCEKLKVMIKLVRYLCQGCVFASVRLSVCLSVCLSVGRITKTLCLNFCEMFGRDMAWDEKHFGGDLKQLDLHPGIF